jgi:hypothetical protein
MKTLLLHVTEVTFDFDDEDFTLQERQSVINSVVGNTYEVEVETDDDAEIADALVEEVTYATGWCVVSLDLRISHTHKIVKPTFIRTSNTFN